MLANLQESVQGDWHNERWLLQVNQEVTAVMRSHVLTPCMSEPTHPISHLSCRCTDQQRSPHGQNGDEVFNPPPQARQCSQGQGKAEGARPPASAGSEHCMNTTGWQKKGVIFANQTLTSTKLL